MKEILVVDDDGETLDAIADLLADAGYKASTAATGCEALRRARSSRPDMFIIDLFMPVMDGFELLARIADEPELARLPKVVMTAWPRPVDLPKGIPLLRKPFEWESLLRLIRLPFGDATTNKFRSPFSTEALGSPLVAALR